MDQSNKAAPGVPFYTPEQSPPSGSALTRTLSADGGDTSASAVASPFQPLKTRGVTLPNRIVVSPMCQYSAGSDGRMTDYHLAHLGQFALRGAGLVFTEVAAVEARGRISPQDIGIWDDGHIAPMRRVFDFLRSQGVKSAIQIGHAGRKATSLAPWIGGSVNKTTATPEVGGWTDMVGPSDLGWSDDYPPVRALTTEEVQGLVKSFADAAVRAVKAGVDVIEIHGAHGYLVTSFLSPLSNNRTDQYGGSFENRTRFLREIITATREVIPKDMPLWVRLSTTEWMEHTHPDHIPTTSGENPSWTVADTTRLALELPSLGVDVLDGSSGGNSARQQIPKDTKLTHLAATREIRKALKEANSPLLIGTVGGYSEPSEAKMVLDEGTADMVLIGRQFLREPEWVLRAAHELGTKVIWPHQYHRAVPKLTSKF